jgi:capsular polysaccharide transport system ATP-binding protein
MWSALARRGRGFPLAKRRTTRPAAQDTPEIEGERIADVTRAPGRAADARAPERAIVLENIVKCYHTQAGTKRVLDGIGFRVGAGEKIAVLGRNGAGKSTLVKLIGGVEQPTAGTISRGLSMSWPIAFGGGFEANMTGYDNIRFIARLYDRPIQETIEMVDDFAELGRNLLLPIRMYSSGMRARLAFALTLAIDFECFLIDEVIAVGDQRFHRKCHDALFVQRANSAMILVSHDIGIIRSFCDRARVLKNGRGRVFNDIDLALDIYSSL